MTLRPVLAVVILGMPGAGCARSGAPPVATAAPAAATAPSAAPAPAADAFAREVAPVLAQRCAPCHKPGGSMYAKLPFDDAATVRSHREGILRRLKGEDLAAVTRWLDAP